MMDRQQRPRPQVVPDNNKLFGGKIVEADFFSRFFLNLLKGDLIAQPFERGMYSLTYRFQKLYK